MKHLNCGIALAILLISAFFTDTAVADVKVKIRQTVGGQTFENTTYIKGRRERGERHMGAMQTVDLTQCDLKRSIQIMPQAQAYTITAWDTADPNATTTTTPDAKNNTTQSAAQKGGVVTMVYTVKDSGERKQMFGYTARHILVTMEMKSSPDACAQINSKMETDGWYIDAAFALDCETERYRSYRPPTGKTGCQDRYETKQIGAGKKGFPVYEKTTMFDESGKEISSFVNEVVELSNATLDAALFDVPAGYREVKDATALYASLGGQMSGNLGQDKPANNSALSQNVQNMAGQTTEPASPSAAELGAKKPGVARIGLATVKTNSVGEGMNAVELAAAIRNTLREYLKSPKIELVALEAKLPQAVDEEAKSKECDFVIYANVAHKKGGGGGFGGMFGKTLGSAVAQTGIGHTGSTIGNVAGQIATQTIVAATLTSNVKAKDELTLDVKVSSSTGAATFAKQYKAKAKSDGEDIMTPLIEQAAQAIMNATT